MSLRHKVALGALLAAACASSARHEERERLIEHHRAIFSELGISPAAVEELCTKVAWVHDAMKRQRAADPEAYAMMEAISRRGSPQSFEEALEDHRRRFDALRLTPSTQRELEEAFALVWHDLRSNAPSPRAQRIRQLMAQLPPCCDDAIWERAGLAP